MAEAEVSSRPVLLDRLEAGVLTLTLNRPERLNALDAALIEATRYSAFSVTRHGAQKSFATEAEFAAFSARNPDEGARSAAD